MAFQAFPIQNRLMDTLTDGRYRIVGFGGGIRGTKTWGGLAVLMTLCRQFPGSRWCVVRKDLQRVKDTVLPTFDKLRAETGGFIGPVQDSQTLSFAARCRNGSVILFRGENIDVDPQLERFHGYEVNGFLNEEADELDEQTLWKEVERAGAWIIPGGVPQPPIFVLNTFNPCGTWPRRLFYEAWKNGTIAAPFAFIPTTAADNPALPAAQREAWRSMPEREYRQFVMGDWEAVSGRFFDDLAVTTHLTATWRLPIPGMEWARLPAWWTYWASYDWGFRHPAVGMAFAKNGDGQTYLLETVKMRRMGDEEQAEQLAALLPPGCLTTVYAGHDAFNVRQAHTVSIETTADVFGRHRIYLTKANTTRVQGWAALRRLLTRRQSDGAIGTPRLLICDTPGNRWAIEQLLELTPDPTNPEDVTKVDANDDGIGGDDAADCLRYGCLIPGLLPTLATEVRNPGMAGGRDPRMRQERSGQWVGPERELAATDVAGVVASFPENW